MTGECLEELLITVFDIILKKNKKKHIFHHKQVKSKDNTPDYTLMLKATYFIHIKLYINVYKHLFIEQC